MDSRIQQLKELTESFMAPIPQSERTKLPTRCIKLALIAYFLQCLSISIWWSTNEHAFYPWLITISAIYQVGWVWHKVSELRTNTQQYFTTEDITVPIIDIHTDFNLSGGADHPAGSVLI